MIEAGPASTLPQRVFQTFVRPHDLFARLDERPPWLDVLAIVVAVAVLSVLAVPDDLLVEQARASAERSQVELTTDPAAIAWWERLRWGMGMMVIQPILVFALAGLLALCFSVVGRGDARYRPYLSIAAHAMLIPAAATLVLLPIRFAGEDPGLAFSLATLLPFIEPNGAIGTMLALTSPIALWMLTVAAVGAAAVNRHPTALPAVGVLCGLYLTLNVVLATL